jgi:hypothetical protein
MSKILKLQRLQTARTDTNPFVAYSTYSFGCCPTTN